MSKRHWASEKEREAVIVPVIDLFMQEKAEIITSHHHIYLENP